MDIISFVLGLNPDCFTSKMFRSAIPFDCLPDTLASVLKQNRFSHKSPSKIDSVGLQVYDKQEKYHLFSIYVDSAILHPVIKAHYFIPEMFNFFPNEDRVFIFKNLLQITQATGDLQAFLRRIGSGRSKANNEIIRLLSPLFANSTLQRRSSRENKCSFIQCLSDIPGVVEVTFFDQMSQPLKSYCQICNDDQYHNIYKIKWVYSWTTPKLINSLQFLSLDTSWKPTKPFAYCIVQGCYYNHSIPLGVIIYPSETADLYQEALEFIQRQVEIQFSQTGNTETLRNLKTIPVISDGGTALKKALKGNPKHYLCHHHFLKKYGASSFTSIYMNKILRASISKDTWNKIIPIIQREIETINIKTNSSAFGKYYTKLIKMCNYDPSVQPKTWSIFERIDDHVPLTQNFSESCHSKVNAAFKQRTVNIRGWERKFIQGIMSIVHVNIQHVLNLEQTYHRTVERQISKMNAAIKIEKKKCNCGEARWNKQIFGLNLPCRHCIHSFKLNKECIPKWIPAFEAPNLMSHQRIIWIQVPTLISSPVAYKKPYKFNVESDKCWKYIQNNPLFSVAKSSPVSWMFITAAREVSCVMPKINFHEVVGFMQNKINFRERYTCEQLITLRLSLLSDAYEYFTHHHNSDVAFQKFSIDSFYEELNQASIDGQLQDAIDDIADIDDIIFSDLDQEVDHSSKSQAETSSTTLHSSMFSNMSLEDAAAIQIKSPIVRTK